MAVFTEPASRAEAVDISSTDHTVSDTMMGRGLWVGTSGDVKVDFEDGQAVTLPNVQDGSLLPIRITKVYKTGTTASDMVVMG
jgi:hypothetical protein